MNQIFQTQNTALACTLATCGVPFDSNPTTGAPMPFVNLYDRGVLNRLGYKGSGLTLEGAARDAWQKGKPGTLVYCFKRVDPLDAVIRAWDKHSERMTRADENSGGHGAQPLTMWTEATPEIVAAICCQFAKNRTALLQGWRTAIPWVCHESDVRTTHEGGQTYKVGSMKLHTLGASTETKTLIGL